MNKKIAVVALSASSLVFAGPALSAKRDVFYDTAKVVDVDPIYQTVEISRPGKDCREESPRHSDRDFYNERSGQWDDDEQRSKRDKYVATITGAIVGGVIGNQFGKGDGKDLMTAAGAMLGGVVGSNVARESASGGVRTADYRVQGSRSCDRPDHRHYEQQIVGYRVKYRYHGESFVTRTETHPGKRIKVKVSVQPVEGRHHHSDGKSQSDHRWNF